MTTFEMFQSDDTAPEKVVFTPTRDAALQRLAKFVSRTGHHYASKRNYDFGPNDRSSVSALSPWIRHRVITEEEVLQHVLARHSPSAAMKFVQEVFWRGYFKGWMEQHPSVWMNYQSDLSQAWNSLERDKAMRLNYTDAIEGRTGISCFDHWARELCETGYLHNHARMWFASIWIFTLRLPWHLGADFFLQHLLDGDPASNTLSWRWVAGLHTKGKTYLARASNIAEFTDGRFNPEGRLARYAPALVEDVDHPLTALPSPLKTAPKNALLMLTHEECQPERALTRDTLRVLTPLAVQRQSDKVAVFQTGVALDLAAQHGQTPMTGDWSEAILTATIEAKTRDVVFPYAAVGNVADALRKVAPTLAANGVTLHQHVRAYDALTWPHTTKGFFKLKKAIPNILSDMQHAT